MHQQPIIRDHVTQYEENPASHNGGMLEDGLTDGLDPFLISQFHSGGAGNNIKNEPLQYIFNNIVIYQYSGYLDFGHFTL